MRSSSMTASRASTTRRRRHRWRWTRPRWVLSPRRQGSKLAKAMESYVTISAPITGQVVEKKINLGEMALPGQPLLKIEDNRNLRLEVTVKEQDILNIRPGKQGEGADRRHARQGHQSQRCRRSYPQPMCGPIRSL